MVTANEILQTLISSNTHASDESVRFDVPLADQGFDSLTMAVLLYELERKYRVSFPTNVVGRLRTLDDVMLYMSEGHEQQQKPD